MAGHDYDACPKCLSCINCLSDRCDNLHGYLEAKLFHRDLTPAQWMAEHPVKKA